MWSQFRVDKNDKDQVTRALETWCQKYEGKYLVALEEGEETGKLHYQGWCCHKASDNTYRKHFASLFKDLGTKQKCFTKVKNSSVYTAYILTNDSKSDLQYDDVITNYTQEEFDELKKEPPFVKYNKQEKGGRTNDVLASFQKHAVVDGRIQYHLLPQIYLRHCPKRINPSLMYDNIVALSVHLEHMYDNHHNERVRRSLMSSFMLIDDKNDLFRVPHDYKLWPAIE